MHCAPGHLLASQCRDSVLLMRLHTSTHSRPAVSKELHGSQALKMPMLVTWRDGITCDIDAEPKGFSRLIHSKTCSSLAFSCDSMTSLVCAGGMGGTCIEAILLCTTEVQYVVTFVCSMLCYEINVHCSQLSPSRWSVCCPHLKGQYETSAHVSALVWTLHVQFSASAAG